MSVRTICRRGLLSVGLGIMVEVAPCPRLSGIVTAVTALGVALVAVALTVVAERVRAVRWLFTEALRVRRWTARLPYWRSRGA